MTYNFDSIAERTSAPVIAALGGARCNTFSPLLATRYQDASDTDLEGMPDFLIKRERCYTFVDTKSGKLNFHRTHASSREALAEAYMELFRRPSHGMTHSALSRALHDAPGRHGLLASLEHGFNHSVFKLAAVQAKHGWQRFLVVFKKSPSKREAFRYLEAGLVFCTDKTLPSLMSTIELCQHGWLVPFVFHGPGYSFSVSPDPASRGLSPEEVEANDRTKFLAAVAADEAAEAAQKAKSAADLAAGILPF